MKLGVENKRSVIWLSVLGAGLIGSIYYNFFYDSYGSSTPATTRIAAPAPSEDSGSGEAPASRGRIGAFLPALHKKRGDKTEPPPSDPTLRLDLLAKLDAVPAAGSGRNLFNFGKAAPVILAGTEPKIDTYKVIGPPHLTVPGPKPPPPPPPPPPPIPLKYYGICTTRADGQKTAFFMDGDEILIQAEGSSFKGRYRLLRIGIDSAVVEDMQYKHEQTLPLAEDAQPGKTGE